MHLNINNNKGILLFEVIVSVAILVVGLTMVSRSFTNCIRAWERARDYNTATLLAEELLWKLEIKEQENWLKEGGFEEYPRFDWSLESEDIEDIELKDVRLNINWKERGRDYSLTVFTFM